MQSKINIIEAEHKENIFGELEIGDFFIRPGCDGLYQKVNYTDCGNCVYISQGEALSLESYFKVQLVDVDITFKCR